MSTQRLNAKGGGVKAVAWATLSGLQQVLLDCTQILDSIGGHIVADLALLRYIDDQTVTATFIDAMRCSGGTWTVIVTSRPAAVNTIHANWLVGT